MPTWLQQLPALEAESGIPDGPAMMMTFAPKQKVWDVPDIGLGITEVAAPERMTMTLEIDPKGFKVKGNMKFRSEAEAESFVTGAQSARQTALDTEAFSFLLKRAKAYNAIKGLSLRRTDTRVAYSTTISIAAARVLWRRAPSWSPRCSRRAATTSPSAQRSGELRRGLPGRARHQLAVDQRVLDPGRVAERRRRVALEGQPADLEHRRRLDDDRRPSDTAARRRAAASR